MRRKILRALDEFRPYLQADGGDVEFVDYVDNIVSVRLVGACGTCPHATVTLKHGIERHLKEKFPEIISVEQV